MNEVLERRYRRWLRLYPKTFRRDHGDEIVGVLLARAAAGQTRPRVTELVNLGFHGLLWRARHLTVPPAWEYRYAVVMLPVRLMSGMTLLALTVVLYGYDRAGWWTPVLVPAALANFYVARRLSRAPAQRQ